MNRKRMILTVLLGILALCLLYAFYATPRQQKAPPRTVAQGSGKVKIVKKEAAEVGDERVHLDLLNAEPEPFPGAERDIFRFKQRYLPKPVKVEKTAKIDPEPELLVPVVPLPPTPIEVMQRALGKFTFLGFLEKSGEKSVFLSSGGEIYIVKRGERFGIEKEFEVASIDDNLLKVRRIGQDVLIEIPLIEQQKLNATISAPAQTKTQPQTIQGQSQVSPSSPSRRARTSVSPRRMSQPAAPLNVDENVNETNAEEPPEEDPEVEFENGDALEGEVDGSNQ